MTLIRTLHWDSDPSTLQLHSDSELGYWTLSSLLSWSFSLLSIYGMIIFVYQSRLVNSDHDNSVVSMAERSDNITNNLQTLLNYS